MSKKKTPTKYTLLQIGYEHFLLPNGVNQSAILKALSQAVPVRWGYDRKEEEDYYFPKLNETKLSISIIPARKVRAEEVEDDEPGEQLRLTSGTKPVN